MRISDWSSDVCSSDLDERASQRWMRKWDNEAKAFTTPEATVDEFFAKNPVWVETVAGPQTGSTEVFEVIPMIRIRTGRDSLPSMKFDGKGGRDEAARTAERRGGKGGGRQ